MGRSMSLCFGPHHSDKLPHLEWENIYNHHEYIQYVYAYIHIIYTYEYIYIYTYIHIYLYTHISISIGNFPTALLPYNRFVLPRPLSQTSSLPGAFLSRSPILSMAPWLKRQRPWVMLCLCHLMPLGHTHGNRNISHSCISVVSAVNADFHALSTSCQTNPNYVVSAPSQLRGNPEHLCFTYHISLILTHSTCMLQNEYHLEYTSEVEATSHPWRAAFSIRRSDHSLVLWVFLWSCCWYCSESGHGSPLVARPKAYLFLCAGRHATPLAHGALSVPEIAEVVDPPSWSEPDIWCLKIWGIAVGVDIRTGIPETNIRGATTKNRRCRTNTRRCFWRLYQKSKTELHFPGVDSKLFIRTWDISVFGPWWGDGGFGGYPIGGQGNQFRKSAEARGVYTWLVVTGCHEFYFPRNIGLLIIPID